VPGRPDAVRILTDVTIPPTGPLTGKVPLTGNQYQIEAGPYRAMLTALGAGLREFCYRDEPLLHGYQPDELPPAAAGQLLAPWPNRIDNGRYTFNGAEEQLAVSEPAKSTAIHGLTRWANWTGIRHDASAVLLRCEPHGQQGYPFSVEIDALYEVDAETGLRVTITARNRGSHPAPYGNGWHPYFQVATPSIDECELTLPASRYLPLDERGLPSGPAEAVDGTQYDFRKPRTIGDTSLDTPMTGLITDAGGRAWAHLAADGNRLSLWVGEGYRWLQVFTGDTLGPDRRRKAIAIEPMTCPPNAFVTGEDLLVLQPGDEVTQSWGITAS
jgi:aldose 1-epimerase